MEQKLILRYLKARKEYISGCFSQLNSMQQKAVMTTQGPLLILAGAGSGKTTVLINRISNLMRFGRAADCEDIPDHISPEDVEFLEQLPDDLTEQQRLHADYLCSVDVPNPWNIIAITFTNKAANELKDRLTVMLGEKAQDVWAMTFHSACCRILRREIDRLGYSRSFTIYDASDSERVIKDIIKNLDLDDKTFAPKYVMSIISKEKDYLTSPDELIDRAESVNDYKLLQIGRIYQKYQTRLKENDALDFDDIILNTVILLRDFKEVRDYYQQKFHYVLVDEYQDTNHLQYLLTSLLAGGYENICVVGDDDQSIYRFRGATIENILNFERQYPASQVVRLEQNYRSTQSILNAANAVIACNTGRKGKKLWTSNGAGSPITVYEAADEGAEANFVANRIISESKGKNFKDFAILYRTNAQSNTLEYALKRNAIPYRVIGGTRFFDRAEIKDMLSYLCVINNRSDDLRLRRIINVPARGLGAKALEVAERMAEAEGKGLYHVISDPYSYGPLEKAAAKFMQFTVLIEELAILLEDGMELPVFYDELIKRTGYADMLEKKGTEESKTKLENVRELKSSILAYVQNSEQPTLAGFLEEVALYTDLEEFNDSDDAVIMLTMHAAKGLEFPNVFLVGFEDGLFPGVRAIGDYEEMEEERRLCYVAITRAKKNLTICHAKQRMLYGRTTASLPSRFLKEIPDDITVKKGSVYTPVTHSYSRESYMPRTAAPVKRSYTQYTPPKTGTYLELNRGDMVIHAAFGKGLVLSVVKMGNDALLEIAFDDIGTKKLMAKTASAHMKRL